MKVAAILKLSARSVGRNVRRSMLTAAAMCIGLALLIFSRGLAEGGHEQWIDSAVRLGSGHVAVQAPRFLETGRLENRLAQAQVERVTALLDSEPVRRSLVSWAPHLTVSGLASSATSALPVQVQGVDPEREAVFSDIDDKVQEGRYLEPGDRLHAFVGVELARRLDLEVGSRLVLTAQDASGEISGQLVRVVGIFRTAIPEMDEGLVHIPIETARSWLQTPGAATTLALLLTGSRETDRVAGELSAEVADDPGIRVMGWRQAAPDLDSAVRIDDYGDYVFHTILFAIVALAILNSVMMSVLGRQREFAILRALGLTRTETGMVVFGEGLFLTLASGVVGVAIGYAVTWGLFRNGLDLSGLMENDMSFSGGIVEPVIVPAFHLDQVTLSVFFMALIGTLSSVYPAVRAARLDVAEAMKFER